MYVFYVCILTFPLNCCVPFVKNRTGDGSERTKVMYRSISLTTIISKVFDGVLGSRPDEHLHFRDAQFGFKPGLSAKSSIFSLKQNVEYYTETRMPIYACFLDLSRAFDLVRYDTLCAKHDSTGSSRELAVSG